MPGMLSSIFDTGDASDGAGRPEFMENDPQASDGSVGDTGHASDDSGSSGSSDSSAIASDGGIDLDPSLTVHTDMGGDYQSLDGSTGSWSDSSDVTVHADVGATMDMLAGGQQDESTDFS